MSNAINGIEKHAVSKNISAADKNNVIPENEKRDF